MPPTPTRRRRLSAVLATTLAVAVGLTPTLLAPPPAEAAAIEVAPAPAGWPVFGFQGIVTNKSTMRYNLTNEYIFPSVIRAGDYFADPLGEWYLYTAPHEDPGGIVLMYADSLEGPWLEYDANPIIANEWQPHYGRVPHVSSPDAVWNPEEQKVFLYFHGNNSVTRYATSDDGITFEYGGVAVTNAMGDVAGRPKVIESSYARVFEHPDPDSPYGWAMFYMANNDIPVGGPGGVRGVRNIRLAESVDGRSWVVDPEPVFLQGAEEGVNVSGPNLWEHDGRYYVLYHASSGRSYARPIERTLRGAGDVPILLHRASGQGSDTGRVASPEVVEADGETYLFYEAGDRLGATIAWAKAGADPVTTPVHGDFPADLSNPLFALCAAEGSDEFDGSVSATWDRVVREDAARHRVEDGSLVIPTYSGGLAAAPLIQQELPDGQWQVTTKLNYHGAGPSLNFQQAGLLLYGTDTQYARFTLGKATPGRGLELVGAGSPTFTDQAFTGHAQRTEAWMRLTSDGVQIVATVSFDGVNFTVFGRPFPARTDDGSLRYTHLGPYAYRGNAATEIEASFDWVRFSPTTQAYADCMTVPTSPTGTVSIERVLDGTAADDPFLAGVGIEVDVRCEVEDAGRRVELFAGTRTLRGGERIALADDGAAVILPAGARCWVDGAEAGGASATTLSHGSWEDGAVVTSGSPSAPQELALAVTSTYDAAAFTVSHRVAGLPDGGSRGSAYEAACTWPTSTGSTPYPLAAADAAFTLASGGERVIEVLAGVDCTVRLAAPVDGTVIVDSDATTPGGASDGVLGDVRGTTASASFRLPAGSAQEIELSRTTVGAGGVVEVSGDGFAADIDLTIELHSDPVVLATARTDARGAFRQTVTIPAATTPGSHTIVVLGGAVQMRIPLTVTGGGAGMAATGAELSGWTLGGAALLLGLGAGLVMIGLRRRSAVRRLAD